MPSTGVRILDTPQHDCSLLGTPPKWMMDVYAELGRDTP